MASSSTAFAALRKSLRQPVHRPLTYQPSPENPVLKGRSGRRGFTQIRRWCSEYRVIVECVVPSNIKMLVNMDFAASRLNRAVIGRLETFLTECSITTHGHSSELPRRQPLPCCVDKWLL